MGEAQREREGGRGRERERERERERVAQMQREVGVDIRLQRLEDNERVQGIVHDVQQKREEKLVDRH